MSDGLFGNFGGINSFNTSQNDSGETDSWLVKQNGMLLGPMSTAVVNSKMLSGEIDTKSLIAAEGDEDFNPIRQLAVFTDTVVKAEQLAVERAAKKRRNNILATVFALVALTGGAGYVAKTMQLGPFAPPPPVEQKKQLSLDDIPTIKLVALADIEKAAESITVKEEPKAEKSTKAVAKKTSKPKTKSGTSQKASADDDDEVVAGCQLDTKLIIGVVQRSAGKWVSCIQNLAQTEPNMVPDKLVLSFTVTPAGKLTNFDVGNRELKKHPVRNCLFKQFSGMSFPKSNGTNCNVDNWTIPLKK